MSAGAYAISKNACCTGNGAAGAVISSRSAAASADIAMRRAYLAWRAMSRELFAAAPPRATHRGDHGSRIRKVGLRANWWRKIFDTSPSRTPPRVGGGPGAEGADARRYVRLACEFLAAAKGKGLRRCIRLHSCHASVGVEPRPLPTPCSGCYRSLTT